MIPAAVAGMLPRRPRQAIARVSVSALVASLPLLYVSLLRPPPAALAGDTAFWFLVSNCVIAAIVATSDDAGTLLFKSAADDDDPCGGDLSCVSPVTQPPAVAVQGISGDAVVPLAASPLQNDEPPAVDVHMNGGRVQGEVTSPVAGSYHVHHALPSVMEGEEEYAASKPSAEINNPVQRGEEEKEGVTTGPRTVKSNTIKVDAHGEEDGEVVPLATVEAGTALATDPEPEPWSSSRVLTSTKSLPEEEALCYRPPEEPAAQGVAAAKEGGLQRSATVGRKPAAEESEYWQLSDEELNRRVEDFIARFNREMRLQVEQEAGVI